MRICVQNGGITNRLGFDEGYRLIAEAGFEAIDWNIDVHLQNDKVAKAPVLENLCIFDKSLDEMLEFFAPELDAIKANGLQIAQAHAPFGPFVNKRPEATEYYIEVYKNIIKLCDAVGCKNLIIHSCVNHPAFGMTPAQTFDLNMHLYGSLIDTLLQTDVTVCLENLFYTLGGKIREATCSDPHEAAEYIDKLNALAGKECFGLCVDTGHLMLLGRRFPTYMPIVGKRVKALHIHDNDGMFDRHLAPFTGITDWREFVDSLRQIGYCGDLSFETFGQMYEGRIDTELMPMFAEHIADIGKYFREKIIN